MGQEEKFGIAEWPRDRESDSSVERHREILIVQARDPGTDVTGEI